MCFGVWVVTLLAIRKRVTVIAASGEWRGVAWAVGVELQIANRATKER